MTQEGDVQSIDWSKIKKHSDLAQYLADLPDQKSRDYEREITDIAEHCPTDRLDWFTKILENDKWPVEVRFSAFFVLATHCRRYQDFEEFERLVNNFGPVFDGQPMYIHVRGLFFAGRGDPGDLDTALSLSKQASESLPTHSGALHAFASNVAAAVESGISIDPTVLDEAEKALNTAIGLEREPYAKYYCTKGRFLAIRGKWDQAQTSIRKAMRLEKEGKTDYALRINEYRAHLASVQTKEMMSRQEKIQSQMERQLDDLRGQSLATLGLFTAILSFTLGSIQIARAQPFDQAARLIIVMAGSLMAVYGVFAMIVRRKSDQGDWPLAVATLIGVAVVLIAYFA